MLPTKKSPPSNNKASKPKKPISPQKAAALAKATAASKDSLQGKSPRTAGVERAKMALLWVYRWGWTTTALLEIGVGSSANSGLAARLVKRGLLVKTETASAGVDGSPSHYLTLSRLGLEHATELSDLEIPYRLNPARINQATMNHNEIVQRLTAIRARYWIGGESAEAFLTEKELRIGRDEKAKIPDAMWRVMYENPQNPTYADDLRPSKKVAVELELSPKWRQELDTFVYQSLMQLKTNTCEGIEIFSRSKALLARYQLAFKPGTMLQTWTRAKGFWEKGSQTRIPERENGVVRFTLLTPEMLGL
jgi:hypothetical protein